MPEHPLKPIEDLDSGLFNLMNESRELSMGEGVIPRKYKILIALALDAAHGATDGVASLARQALQAGATKEEIGETLRVTHYISGVGSIYVAAAALKEIV